MEEKVKKLSEQAVLADLDLSEWSGSVYDKGVADEILDAKDAAHNRGQFSKKIFLSTKNLTSIINEVRDKYTTKTTAWERGKRLLPIAHWEPLMELIRDCNDKLEKVLEEDYRMNWESYKEQTKKDLGQLYNESQYPTYEQFKKKWGIRIDVQPLPESGHFVINCESKMLDVIQKNFESNMGAKEQAAIADMKSRIIITVQRIVERLEGKRIHFSSQGKEVMDVVRELVDLLPTLNVFNDSSIDAMVDELKKNLCGITDDDLKEQSSKEKILADTKKMLDKMAEYAD